MFLIEVSGLRERLEPAEVLELPLAARVTVEADSYAPTCCVLLVTPTARPTRAVGHSLSCQQHLVLSIHSVDQSFSDPPIGSRFLVDRRKMFSQTDQRVSNGFHF
jgi:hypothetical protein